MMLLVEVFCFPAGGSVLLPCSGHMHVCLLLWTSFARG